MQQPLRRVPVPLREVLEDTLDDLVQQDILAPVQQPTPLLGGHPEKKDGKLHICFAGARRDRLGHRDFTNTWARFTSAVTGVWTSTYTTHIWSYVHIHNIMSVYKQEISTSNILITMCKCHSFNTTLAI